MAGAICIVCKAPNAGEAKTRLIPALGAGGAAGLARALLLDTLDRFSGCEEQVYLATTGLFSPRLQQRLREYDGTVIPQGDGNLGVRLQRIVSRGLTDHDWVTVIGTDCPTLGPDHLERVRCELASHDAVLIPAMDGGFTLLALKRCPRGALSWNSLE